MNIKEFFATLGIEVDEADWKQADAVLSSVEHGLELVSKAAVFASDVWNAFVGDTVAAASEIQKLASIMGTNTDAAQEWAYIANTASLSADDMAQMASELAENLGEAAGGTGEAADAFKSLNLTLKDSKGKLKETPQMLLEIADKMAGMADGQKKTSALMGLFGEEGIKLLPILNKGSGGIAELAQEARDLGLILDESTIKKSTELARDMKVLGSILDSFKASIGGEIIPLLVEVAKGFQAWWKINGAMIKQRLHEVFSLLMPVLKVLLFLVSTLAKVLVFLLDNWKLVALVLARVLLPILWEMLLANAQLIISWIAVGAEAAAAGASATGAWLRAIAPLVLLLLVLEDVWGWFNGKDSLIGGIIDAWKKDWNDFIDAMLVDNPDDPWWLKAIKTAVQEIKILIDYLESLEIGKRIKILTGETPSGRDKRIEEIQQEAAKSAPKIAPEIAPEQQQQFTEMFTKYVPLVLPNYQMRPQANPAMLPATTQNSVNNPTVNIVLPDNLNSKEEIVTHIKDSVSDIFGNWLGEAKNGAK